MLLLKNSVYIVLTGHTTAKSATSVDISVCFQFAKCSMNKIINKTHLVKISPTGLQLIGKSHYVAKKNQQYVAAYAWNVLYKITLFCFGDDILLTNKQTYETIFSLNKVISAQ